MPYAVEISPPVLQQVGGRIHRTWTIVETDASSTDSFVLHDVPTYCTLSLYEAARTDEEADPTVQPEIYVGGEESLALVARAFEPLPSVRIQSLVRVFASDNRLLIRSQANVEGAVVAAVTTRITLVEGHA